MVRIGMNSDDEKDAREWKVLRNHDKLSFGKKLGSGSFSRVYRLQKFVDNKRSKKLALDYVVKIYKQYDGDKDDITAEVNVLEKMGACAFIIALIEAGTWGDGGPFALVLPYYRFDLSVLLAQQSKGMESLVTLPVLTALNYLHLRGVIHGDVKPGNILISEDHQQVVLGDFNSCVIPPTESDGVMVMEESWATSTLWYRSQRQMNEQDFSYECDWQSFGLVLYECMTLTPAMPCDTESEGVRWWKNYGNFKTNKVLPLQSNKFYCVMVDCLEATFKRRIVKHVDLWKTYDQVIEVSFA